MPVLAAAPHHGAYLHWGVLDLSWTNLAIVGVMLAVFVLALVLPFPRGRR